MDTRLVGRVIDAVRTVNPLLAVSAAALDLDQPPASGNVRAQVAARLADGSFRVLIDGKALKLALPADIKPGDVLQLRVVGREAMMAPHASQAASAAGSSVSSAGQLVADLVRLPPAAPARQSQPALDLPPQQAQTLAAPLARAVERSGLFYESHQARWVGGEYPLERLLQEPQASAGRHAPPKAAVAAVPGDDAPPTSDMPAPLRPSLAAAAEPKTEAEQTPMKAIIVAQDSADAGAKLSEKAAEIVSRDAVNIVRQQLDALETRHFHWLGEIWPGQPMRWEIGEETGGQEASPDAQHAWDSRFELELPALGSVGADLALSGNRLRLRVSAEDAATVAMMREAAQELMHALAAAGVETWSFEVEQREPSL